MFVNREDEEAGSSLKGEGSEKNQFSKQIQQLKHKLSQIKQLQNQNTNQSEDSVRSKLPLVDSLPPKPFPNVNALFQAFIDNIPSQSIMLGILRDQVLQELMLLSDIQCDCCGLDDNYSVITQRLSRSTSRVNELERQLISLKERLVKSQRSRQQERNKNKKLLQQNDKLIREMHKNKMQENQFLLKQQQEKISSLKSQLRDLNQLNEMLRKQVRQNRQQQMDLQDKISQIQRKYELCLRTDLQKNQQKALLSNQKLQLQVQDLSADLAFYKNQLSSAGKKIQQLSTQNFKLKKNFDQLKLKYKNNELRRSQRFDNDIQLDSTSRPNEIEKDRWTKEGSGYQRSQRLLRILRQSKEGQRF